MKMTKIGIIICVQFLCFALIHPATVWSQSGVPYRKFCAAYLGLKPVEQAEEQLRLLHQHGFNTVLVADGAYQLKEDLWRAWGMLAGELHVQVFPVLNFAVPQELKGQYRPYLNRDGAIDHATPCPLDREYWQAVIGQRFEQLAQLSTVIPIAGLLFDSEMYGSDFSIYYEPCFCDICWKQFVQTAQPIAPTSEPQNIADLPRDQRFDYLVRHHLFWRYTDVQTQQVQAILAQIEQQVHAINPHLLFGYLGHRNNWFYTGLIQGLGTITRPVLVFTESTYVVGSTPYAMEEMEFVTKQTKGERQNDSPWWEGSGEGKLARYIPGLWLARFFPDDLPAQLYHLATQTDGYWIFTADSLWKDAKEPKRRFAALHGRKEDYWAAIKHANEDIVRFSQAPESYQPDLPSIFLSSYYDPLQNRLFTRPSLRRFLQQIPLKEGSDAEITYRAETLFHCLNPGGGTIEIIHYPIGEYADDTQYRLFDNDGQVVQEGIVNARNRYAFVKLPVNSSGLVSLWTNSGTHAVRVRFSGIPYVIEASSTFPLTTMDTARTYTVYIPPGTQRLKLRAFCPENAYAGLTVRSSDGRVNETIEVEGALYGFVEISLPVPEGQDDRNVWTISVNPIPDKPFGDIQFSLYAEEYPYLMVGE
jgi:hypothetical protein